MKSEVKTQKGFIQIPLLVIIIASIIAASVGTGVILHKQGKLTPLVANISQVFEGDEEPIVLEPEEVKPGSGQVSKPTEGITISESTEVLVEEIQEELQLETRGEVKTEVEPLPMEVPKTEPETESTSEIQPELEPTEENQPEPEENAREL